jgi:hypothetical protein
MKVQIKAGDREIESEDSDRTEQLSSTLSHINIRS